MNTKMGDLNPTLLIIASAVNVENSPIRGRDRQIDTKARSNNMLFSNIQFNYKDTDQKPKSRKKMQYANIKYKKCGCGYVISDKVNIRILSILNMYETKNRIPKRIKRKLTGTDKNLHSQSKRFKHSRVSDHRQNRPPKSIDRYI